MCVHSESKLGAIMQQIKEKNLYPTTHVHKTCVFGSHDKVTCNIYLALVMFFIYVVDR